MTNPLVRYLTRQRGRWARLLILTHDHPDPDALAAAWALAQLVRHCARCRSQIVYGGVVGRVENQLLLRLLRVPARPLRPQDFAEAHVALVDTQPPFQNNRFPRDRCATLIVDHHPRHPRTTAEFSWIDPRAGATTTLLGEAVAEAGLEIPTRLATAMAYAISSETQTFARDSGPRDIAVYQRLFPRVSVRSLSKIQNPPRPSAFFATLARAVHNAFVVGRVIGVHLGPVHNQDLVAHMADFLLTHERMRWSLVTGRYRGRLCVSVRTRDRRAEAGRLLWRLLGSGTSAGGHAMIAGGSILVGERASEPAWVAVEHRVTRDFLHSQGCRDPIRPRHPYRAVRRDLLLLASPGLRRPASVRPLGT